MGEERVNLSRAPKGLRTGDEHKLGVVEGEVDFTTGGEAWLSFIPSPIPFVNPPDCVFSLDNSVGFFCSILICLR